jgi:SOS-response transcriptional repressor LexA
MTVAFAINLCDSMGMEIHAIRLQALRGEIAKFPTLVAFARHYGLDTTYISQLLHGHRNMGEKAARKLEAQLGWPPLTMDHGGAAAPTRFEANVSAATRGLRQVPRISFVQAGPWREVVDPYAPGAAEDYLLTDLELGPHAFALTIHGDSMTPEFREGDTIIIDPSVKPAPGDFVVAKNDQEEATFKKYRPRGVNAQGELVIELVPLNDDYPSLRSDCTPLQIIGTMMEHRRYRKPR